MAEPFRPLPLRTLARWVFDDLDRGETVLGIPVANLRVPGPRLASTLHGHDLAVPLGVSAGPHTQLAQNIVAAWLCGARFIELKTVQILDRIQVSRPCIDAAEETYNCEWSQELTLEQSRDEYLKAWVLVHALAHRLGLPGPGSVFAMSVGYDLAGVQEPRVQAFVAALRQAAEPVAAMVEEVAEVYPAARDLPVPAEVSDLVTLSTMHGCPPSEIERIARHLLLELGLHTWVKVNPTLLGPDRVRGLLHAFGYDHITVPDEAFAHDPTFDDAMAMVRRLAAATSDTGPRLGLKLTNTLEVVNHRDVFPASERMMYLSGAALHPITLTLAHRVTEELDGAVPLSFSGGADADNVADLVADGLGPVTVCTDLLRPGGYARLGSYLEHLESAWDHAGAATLEDYLQTASGGHGPREALAAHAARIGSDRRYASGPRPVRFKGVRALGRLDCVAAPCLEDCPTHQNVPDYLWALAHGHDRLAVEIIERANPMPGVTGRICDHPCTERCVRSLYDAPLAIRDLKRFAVDRARSAPVADETPGPTHAPGPGRVAVVGGGPAGIAVAVHLARLGFAVEVFEARSGLGGMTRGFLPGYRMDERVLEGDLAQLDALGVVVHPGRELHPAGSDREPTLTALRAAYDEVFLAVGAQRSRRLGVPGEDARGVVDALWFLERAGDRRTRLGASVLVVGGGNTAMDAARSARRLDPGAAVALVYRRTRAEMPADPDEVRAVLEEGIALHELLSPVRIEAEDGAVRALVCHPMRLGEVDASGRRRAEPAAGEERLLSADVVIVAVGQEVALDTAPDGPGLTADGRILVDPVTGETTVPGVFAGGDAARGPASVVEALGDGARAARAIAARHGLALPEEPHLDKPGTPAERLARKATRVAARTVPELPVAARGGFDEVLLGFDEEQARAEAARCLDCDELCSLCVTVCPNRAHQAYPVRPESVRLPVLQVRDGALERVGDTTPPVHQPVQTLVLADACNDCGHCVPFCPTAGSPFQDKPRVWLDPDGYAEDARDGFRFLPGPRATTLEARVGGRTHRLTWDAAHAAYDGPEVRLELDLGSGEPVGWSGAAGLAEGHVVDLGTLEEMLVLRHAPQALAVLAEGEGAP